MSEQVSKTSKPSRSKSISKSKSTTKRKPGRPPNNKRGRMPVITKADYPVIEECAANGYGYAATADTLEVHADTYRKYRNNLGDRDKSVFDLVLKRGRARWREYLMAQAKRYINGPNGQNVLIFSMKQEQGMDYKDNQHMTHTGTIKHEHSPALLAWEETMKGRDKVIEITPNPEVIDG